MLKTFAVALAMLFGLVPAAARAATVEDIGGLASPTNGIVLGPDGNLWVSESANGSVVRLTPAGAVLGRFAVGSAPASLAAGPGGGCG
jgi:streptogramin lyase